MRFRFHTAIGLVAAGLVVAGCGSTEQDPPMSQPGSNHHAPHQNQQLQTRPSIEEATARYEQMRTEIRERLSAETGIQPWRDVEGAGASGCADFPDTAGESHGIRLWVSDRNLPDDQWPQAEQVVHQVVRNYGFREPQVLIDKPGAHQLTVDDQYGARLSFGTGKRTVLDLYTGCHLPQAEKNKTEKPQGQASGDPAVSEIVHRDTDGTVVGFVNPERFRSR